MDITRAVEFYQRVLGRDTGAVQQFDNTKMAVVPDERNDQDTVRGSIVQSENHEPSTKGSLIFLAGGDDLSAPLARVVDAGGTVVQEKTPKGHHGFYAIFEDTEGNHVALHSMN